MRSSEQRGPLTQPCPNPTAPRAQKINAALRHPPQVDRPRPLDLRRIQDAHRWQRLPSAARRVIALTALSLGLQAHALQVVEASDGVAVEAIASIKEPTRIRIDGAPITDVFGNIQASHCGSATPLAGAPASASGAGSAPPPNALQNPTGEVVVECDRDKGEIYIRPSGPNAKPINLFVASATATYTLILRRSDTPADTILIRDKTPRALRPTKQSAPAASTSPSPSHARTMKALLVAMASDRVPPDVRVEEVARPIRLWAEARFQLIRLYEGRGFVGELYSLQNMSALPMVLAEQEFDRPEDGDGGEAAEVAGVAIDNHNLLPGESTRVYVIRRGGVR